MKLFQEIQGQCGAQTNERRATNLVPVSRDTKTHTDSVNSNISNIEKLPGFENPQFEKLSIVENKPMENATTADDTQNSDSGVTKATTICRQPDITYQPDLEKYLQRTDRRKRTEILGTELPKGFPKQLESPLVWSADDFKSEEWVTYLTTSDQNEILEALQSFKRSNLPPGRLCQETFPLPSLGPRLRDLSKEIHCGRGFVVLRNFPVDGVEKEDTILAYAGVSSYIASLRAYSDRSGAVIVHVTDLHQHEKVGTPAYTNDRQGFHTDNGDVVALLALSTAEQGGTSKLASSWYIYNVLAKSRPDLITTMKEPWPCDNFGGDPPHYMRPIMYYTEEKRLVVQFFRRSYTGFRGLPRPANIPPITEAQAEALDALEFISRDSCIKMDLQKGDIQYINNLSILHARDGYTDSAENSRYLLRMWLRDKEFGWRIPTPLQRGPGRSWDALKHEETSNSHRFPIDPEIKLE